MSNQPQNDRHGGHDDTPKAAVLARKAPDAMTAAAVIGGVGDTAFARFLLGLGEIRGVRRIRDLLTAEFVGALLRLRDSKEYRQHGLTWEQTCDLIGVSKNTLNEEIQNLEAFGAELFEIVRTSEFNRAAVRTLRAAHDIGEIRLLEGSNELVVGEKVIAVTQENQTQITSAFVELLNREKDEKAAVEKELADAQATIAKGRAQLEAKETELAEKDTQIQVAASILAVMRHDHPMQAAADAIEVRLAELIQQMRDGEFDKAEAVRIHRRLSDRITDLARYAHGATLDEAAAFARLSPEMQEIIRASDAEHAADPFGSELDDEEEVGDEE